MPDLAGLVAALTAYPFMTYGLCASQAEGISLKDIRPHDVRGMAVQTVHPSKMSKISKFGGWPWDRYGILEGA